MTMQSTKGHIAQVEGSEFVVWKSTLAPRHSGGIQAVFDCELKTNLDAGGSLS
jgi:hypothetical protein